MDPKVFLIWTCSFIFAATGIITLLGLTKMIAIDRGYLNKLFTSLILEIVAIGVLAFNQGVTEPAAKDPGNSTRAWLVTAKVEFCDKDGNLLPNQNKLVQDINVQQSNPSIIVAKNEKRIQFWAIGTDKSGLDINLTFVDSKGNFSDVPYNLKYDSVTRIKDGEILIPPIRLTEPKNAYNPPDEKLKSTSDGPQIK
jgi:hypothetical protein